MEKVALVGAAMHTVGKIWEKVRFVVISEKAKMILVTEASMMAGIGIVNQMY